MAESGRIFICYRREETAYSAGWLFDRLADRFGGRIFKDVDSIEPGDDWVEVITTVVGSCDVLLALIGDRWLTITDENGRRRLDDPDDFVLLEIETALTRNVRVIPILVEGASMPRAADLPPRLARLARRQALVLSPVDFDTSRLVHVLDTTLAEVRRAHEDPAARSAAGSAGSAAGSAPEAGATEVSTASETRASDASGPTSSVPPAAPARDPEVPRDSPPASEPAPRTDGAGPQRDQGRPQPPDSEATAEPDEKEAATQPEPTTATGFPGRRLAGRRALVLGVGAAAGVVVLAGAAYVLTHGDGQESTASGSRLVSEDVVLVPLVAQGTPDPVLHQISIPDGSDLGPVNGVGEGSQSWPSQSRDGSLLAYRWAPSGSRYPGESGTLWVAAPGREPVTLFTHDPRDQRCASPVAWSPDGDRVALVCQTDQASTGGPGSGSLSEVVTARLNEAGQIDPDQLEVQFDTGNSPGSHITKIGFAHDGAIVADYVWGRYPGLYLAEPGGDPERLTTQDDRGAAPSPTQDLLAFTREGDLYVASTDGTEPPCGPTRVRATDNGTALCNLTASTVEAAHGSAADPTWSWDGQAIAYEVEDPGTGKVAVRLIELGAGRSVQLTAPTASAGAPGWGPR